MANKDEYKLPHVVSALTNLLSIFKQCYKAVLKYVYCGELITTLEVTGGHYESLHLFDSQ